MRPKIILLGNTGFIGKYIQEELRKRKIQVKGLSSKDINFILSKSVGQLCRILNKEDIIIITAAINRELGDNLKTMQDNIKIIANIATALELKPVKKCVYLSTADVYGIPDELPITEKTSIRPQTYYAAAKFCCESLLGVTAKKGKFPLLIFRYNGVFGSGQRNIGYGANFFIKSILENGTLCLWGDGEELRDSIYVKDLAKIVAKLSLNRASGIYNVAKGKSYSFIEIVKMIRKISDKELEVLHRERTSQSFNQVFDIKKLKRILPKFSFTPMDKALKETYIAFN